jgi:hypothetical protein
MIAGIDRRLSADSRSPTDESKPIAAERPRRNSIRTGLFAR